MLGSSPTVSIKALRTIHLSIESILNLRDGAKYGWRLVQSSDKILFVRIK